MMLILKVNLHKVCSGLNEFVGENVLRWYEHIRIMDEYMLVKIYEKESTGRRGKRSRRR